MTIEEVEARILSYGGEIKGSINWTWAYFPNDKDGEECFNLVKAHIDHRGYYHANPGDSNPNFHRGGFRYRGL